MKIISSEPQNLRGAAQIQHSEDVLISRSELVEQLRTLRQAQQNLQELENEQHNKLQSLKQGFKQKRKEIKDKMKEARTRRRQMWKSSRSRSRQYLAAGCEVSLLGDGLSVGFDAGHHSAMLDMTPSQWGTLLYFAVIRQHVFSR
jgi:hypothetical protein